MSAGPAARLDAGLDPAVAVLGALSSRDLFRGIVLFIAFGLVLSMCWVGSARRTSRWPRPRSARA
jgi:hypothetical protein